MANEYDEFELEEMEVEEEFNGLEKSSRRGLRRKNNFKKALKNKRIAESVTGYYITKVQGQGKEVVRICRGTPIFAKALNEYSMNKVYNPCKRIRLSEGRKYCEEIKNSDKKRLMATDDKLYEFIVT